MHLPKMRPARFLAALLLSLAALPALRAMSVIPPTFSELVAEADAIVRARVVSLQPFADQSAVGEVLRTRVTFVVETTLKGRHEGGLTLEFLGGAVGELSLEVSGMPRFEPGAQDIVFVTAGTPAICPLVAMGHGRYRILRDAQGAEFVARDNGLPLHRIEDVALPLLAPAAVPVAARPPGGRPLSPAEFAGHVRRTAARIHTP